MSQERAMHSNNSGTDLSASQRLAELPPVTDGVDMTRLVGVPHLFCRLRPLRNGLLFEPMGVLTLEADGRVSGYSNPNEGSWIPYVHGQVSGDDAFAFITAQNNWIPSSTWTQSIGDMPLGYFCDEPELGQSLQRMCLVPNDPLSAQSSLVYLIASCSRFYERTVPALLDQLFAEGITGDEIKVVVNGCATESARNIQGVEYVFSSHDAWEWSALYEAPLRWDFDYAFLLHDTSIVNPGFRRSVKSVNGHVNWDHLPATPMARCLLGLYSHSFLMHCNPWLQSVNHIDKRNGVIAEAAGELLLRARSAIVMGNPDNDGAACAAEWKEIVDRFGTGSPRVRRTFPSVKVDKFIHTGPVNPTSL